MELLARDIADAQLVADEVVRTPVAAVHLRQKRVDVLRPRAMSLGNELGVVLVALRQTQEALVDVADAGACAETLVSR